MLKVLFLSKEKSVPNVKLDISWLKCSIDITVENVTFLSNSIPLPLKPTLLNSKKDKPLNLKTKLPKLMIKRKMLKVEKRKRNERCREERILLIMSIIKQIY